MRHGNIYKPDKVETALNNFFRPGNLAALREIALRLVASSLALSRQVLAPAENVLVAISGRESSEPVIRRGVRLARRLGGLCMVVHVVTEESVAAERYQRLVRELGGSSVAEAIIGAAQQAHVGHVFIGESPAGGFLSRWDKPLADELIDALPGVDLHVIASHHEPPPIDEQRLTPEAILRREQEAARRHAGLRVYLGYADGSGTTTAMLDEARRRRARGTDLVVAAVHAGSASALSGLELLGGPDGAAARDRLHLEALLARNPEVACLDELNGLDTDGRTRAEAIP